MRIGNSWNSGGFFQYANNMNGDALKEQFPENIKGELIVARECLVDGNVDSHDLAELYHSRARFISENYEGYNVEDYYENVVPELNKIQNIIADSDVNLWFEEDLFCQVNLWFVIHLIFENYKNQQVFLVLPKNNYAYNFGGMNKEELFNQFSNKTKIELSELKGFSRLWKLYQENNCDEMIKIAESFENKFPFLSRAVKAHRDRISRNGNPGRPTQTLILIMRDLNTEEFEPIYKEFYKREGIYGFGDLQVKRMLDEMKNDR